MGKSLADLRKSDKVKPQERTYRVCLAGELVGKYGAILNEARELEAERVNLTGGDDRGRKTQRVGDPRLAEIATRLGELEAERLALKPDLDEHSGTLALKVIDSGVWRRFVDENPADEKNWRDQRDGLGVVSAEALLGRLGDFVARWNDEPIGKDDWSDWMGEAIHAGDKNELCGLVVSMHEVAVDLPKLLSASLVTPTDESD